MSFDYADKRQEVIDRMNAGRLQSGKPPLNKIQTHLVHEFFDAEGHIHDTDRTLFSQLMQSNSSV